MTQLVINNTPDALGYVLVYLSGVDGEFDKSEAKVIGQAVHEMCSHFGLDLDGDGDSDVDDTVISINRAFEQFNACETRDDLIKVVVIAVAFLKDCFEKDNRKVIVSRMRALIEADGVLHECEEKTVDLLEEMLMAD